MLLVALTSALLFKVVLVLIVVGLIAGVVWWGLNKLALPQPIDKLLRAIVVIGVVVVCINAILMLVGWQFFNW